MSYPLVFPQPRRVDLAGGEVVVAGAGETVGVDCPGNSPLCAQAVETLRSALAELGVKVRPARGEDAGIAFTIADESSRSEEYEIQGTELPIRVRAASSLGALQAARTLGQTFRLSEARVLMPRLFVRDWPELSWRGVFHEATQSASAKKLEDWRALIDTMGSLKLNILLVGLYSCWRRAGGDSEYFLFPSRRYPQLKTPQHVRYYSPSRREIVEYETLPRMVEEDFLGQLVAYGQARGVTCVPYFSCLGHNTCIPRMFPEISMVDAEGKPKNYGFCTSNPKTYEVLFGLLDEIIERYARPYGVDMFHIGMDEVRNACECPRCRQARNAGEDNFITRHIIKVAEHLKAQGMRRVLCWHDMLERGGLLNTKFVARLEEKGLKDVLAPCWWGYGDLRGLTELRPLGLSRFLSYRPQLGLHNWAAPSAGWNFAAPVANSRDRHTASMQTQAQLAFRDCAEGMISYSSHDPIFLEGYHALGEYSWNPWGTNDIRSFHERYYQRVFGPHWREGGLAMDWMTEAFLPWAGMFSKVFSRSQARLTPGVWILWLAFTPELCNRGSFEKSMAMLKQAGSAFREIAPKRPAFRSIILMYAADCDYIEAVLSVALATLEVVRDYQWARAEPSNQAIVDTYAQSLTRVEHSRERVLRAMEAIERTRHPANAPWVLNRLTGLYDFTESFHNVASRLLRELRKGDQGTLPLFGSDLERLWWEGLDIQPFADESPPAP